MRYATLIVSALIVVCLIGFGLAWVVFPLTVSRSVTRELDVCPNRILDFFGLMTLVIIMELLTGRPFL